MIVLFGRSQITVVKSALVYSDLQTIGWDVAVTEGGVSIIEANWAWGKTS